MPQRVVIAIDGPAGAGKSTIARRVASRLGFTYIDTGAMYRSVALWALRQGYDPGALPRLDDLDIELAPGFKVYLNGEDVTGAIRTPEVSAGASKVAVLPEVRRAMVDKQRAMSRKNSVVMEGRDIGTVVFPDALVKVYLDAEVGERARRRVAERPGELSLAEVAAQIEERDRRDSSRADSPLAKAAGAFLLDSTHMTIEQVEETILKLVEERTGTH